MRLEEDSGWGDSEAGAGGDGAETGAGMETLDQVMPPREKRETVREAPL